MRNLYVRQGARLLVAYDESVGESGAHNMEKF